ncbi:hypothetical protein HMPREF2835_01100 [Actinomyces sp. HMSC072A03]|nr:hypothetical protein HMPREF2835_01100 [Actinomyces sp. HMSC072A03]
MYLKNLTLRGFKSFAGATTMRLEPGITCVVGPNGSGKSNVVDALAWVMGEQGARALRGSAMSDVIFAGTSGKQALGRAQVTLTIDNSDGALPIDYAEVTISRTLFRGGGSEYHINGTQCRLLDVQELLSDTGMGRQMHVIVGQGQLDAILSSTPEERRGFIEEAAGVLKHRRRKERALSKLNQMAGNLARLEDLTDEIRKQLGPLARQAETARRADIISANVRDAKARLLADDAASITERLTSLSESATEVEQRKKKATDKAEAIAEQLAQAEREEAEGSPELESLTTGWQRLTAVAERLRSTQILASERVKSLSVPLTYHGEDPAQLQRRADAATEDDRRQMEQIQAALGYLQEISASKADAEAERLRLERELALAKAVAGKRNKVRERLERELSSANSRLEAATAHRQGALEELALANSRLEAAKEGSAEVSLPKKDVLAAKAHEDASAKVRQAKIELDEARARHQEALEEELRWTSRQEALASTVAPADASATLLDKNLETILGSLPPLLSVEPGYEDQVALALGELAGTVVADSLEGALQAADVAGGPVKIAVAGPVEGKPALGKLSEAVWARQVVQAREGTMEGFLDRALAGVALCENRAQGRLALQNPQVRIVITAEGEVLAAHKVETGGGGTDSVLSLQARLDEAAQKALAASRESVAAKTRLDTKSKALEKAEAAEAQALTRLREADSAYAKAAQEAGALKAALSAAQAERDRAAAQCERAKTEEDAFKTRQVEANRALEEFLQAPAEGVGVEETEQALAEARAQESALIKSETEARLSHRSEEEKGRHLRERASALRKNAARQKEERSRTAIAEKNRKKKLAAALRVSEVCEEAVQAAEAALERARLARAEADEAAKARSGHIKQIRTRLEEARQLLAALTDSAYRSDVAKAELVARRDQLAASAHDELSLTLKELLEHYGPHLLIPNLEDPEGEGYPYVRTEQEKRLRKANRELRALGKVNPLALEQHQALSERYKFLADQLADLRSSRDDLLQIVADVDAQVRRAFEEAFADTRDAFHHVFEMLFPGGQGDLVLTDPDNLLTSGIEIEARPAGKKVKRLSLLSGGERSLAALAMLVAIFKARPSPFYVMDEVEAALDDANLARLLTVFEELRQTSQLIVITHQKRTMEKADALYGVTMQNGVTSVVSQKLSKE